MQRSHPHHPPKSLPARPRPTPRRPARGYPTRGADEHLVALRDALKAVKRGDFSVRLLTEGTDGAMREVARAFNALVEENAALVKELDRLDRAVGTEGTTTARAS